MCIFIVVSLPSDADTRRLQPIFATGGRPLGSPITNACLQQQMPIGEMLFWVTVGHCDCDTDLGRQGVRQEAWDSHVARLRKKGQKKGWSEAKIARALAESEAATSRPHECEDLRRWHQLVEAVITSGATRHIGILLHMYRENPVTECFTLRDIIQATLAEADQTYLYRLRTDTLYLITR
jgi:hypothetical protein